MRQMYSNLKKTHIIVKKPQKNISCNGNMVPQKKIAGDSKHTGEGMWLIVSKW